MCATDGNHAGCGRLPARVLPQASSRARRSSLRRCAAALAATVVAALAVLPDEASAAPAATHGLGLILKAPPPASAHTLAAVRAAAVGVASTFYLPANPIAVGNQGSVNSCAAWATDYTALGYWENEQQIAGGPLAPMFTYSQAAHGQNVGTTLTSHLDLAEDEGVDSQADYWQGTADYWDLPDSQEYAHAADWKLTSYSELPVQPSSSSTVTQQSIETALASGTPVVIGIPVFPSFYNLETGNYPGPADTETSEGGHAVTALGYDLTGLRIENSWGVFWGASGFATLSWSFVNQYVEEAIAVGPLSGSSSIPVNSSPPSLSGTPQEGQMMTVTSGTWIPSSATYSYQWQRFVAGAWSNIPDATSSSYTLGAADVNLYLHAVVTAASASGQTTAASATAGPVASGAPSDVSLPTITGTPDPGKTLKGSAGSWDPSGTYAYQWQRSTDGGRTWSNIAGADRSTYTLARRDGAAELRLVVTATNAFGSSSAASHPDTSARLVQLSIGRAHVARSELTVTIRFVRGSGKVQAAAWRGAQRIQLRAARSRQSVTFTGRLSRGSWTVKLYVFPAAGWQAQTYSIPVRVR